MSQQNESAAQTAWAQGEQLLVSAAPASHSSWAQPPEQAFAQAAENIGSVTKPVQTLSQEPLCALQQ